jgi:hypothetical protein
MQSFSFGLGQDSTPPRKPTIHHCNADRKNNPYKCLNQTELEPICKNLFGNGSGARYAPSQTANAQLKSFRWGSMIMLLYLCWYLLVQDAWNIEVSLSFKLRNDVLKLFSHELIVNDQSQPSSLLVVADGTCNELLMLFFNSYVVVNQHFHI